MNENIQIEGGRKWIRKVKGVRGWYSEDGDFNILCERTTYVLVAYTHEDKEGGVWTKRFSNLHNALEYAEKM